MPRRIASYLRIQNTTYTFDEFRVQIFLYTYSRPTDVNKVASFTISADLQ